MEQTKLISVMIPEMLSKELDEHLTAIGLPKKKKSAWINEALERFFRLNNVEELVYLSETMQNMKKRIGIRVALETQEQLDNLILKVKKKYITLEGVQSLIIRASITQRLLEGMVY